MRGNDWRRRGLVRSSRRGVVEDNWTADEECLFAHPEVETPSGWSHQSEGELEMRIRDRGRNELTGGELGESLEKSSWMGTEQEKRSVQYIFSKKNSARCTIHTMEGDT